MAATTIKGRVTGTTGDPQDLNMTQVVSMLPDLLRRHAALFLIQAEQQQRSYVPMARGRQPEPEPESRTVTKPISRFNREWPGETWTIDNDAVTNAKLANMANGTIRGRIAAGTGDPEDLNSAQATSLLDVFTTGAKGLAPASGGGTSNYLRADGTWAIPPGGAGSYLPLAGGTLTGLLTTADVGVSFGASGSPPTCGTGYYGVYFKSEHSQNVLMEWKRYSIPIPIPIPARTTCKRLTTVAKQPW